VSDRLPYLDPGRDPDARLKDLLKRMSLTEKLQQLGSVTATELVNEEGFDEVEAARLLADGIGQIGWVGTDSTLTPEAGARFANAVQRLLVERTRLGIPAIIQAEAAAGSCVRGATAYPRTIGLAATWAPESVRAMAEAIRGEMRAVGARQALAPALDIARDPRWGRLEETYGEDPYLAGRMGVAYVRGLQGTELAQSVLATGRHFLGYGLPEGGTNQAPVHLGPRELREVFAEPFAAAIRDAGLKAVMNSDSSVDGLVPAGSPEILDELLRGELGFDGMVVSSDHAVDMLVHHHRIARDKGAAAALALTAGLDMELPGLDCFGAPLHELVEAGKVDLALVDRAVRRVLALKFELGLFDEPYVEEAGASAQFERAESRALAGLLAEQSMVLLKNDGILPLERGCRLALIGPAADDARLLLGDGHGPDFAPIVTPREALETLAEVDYRPGCTLTGTDEGAIAAAVAAARAADVAVVCVGGKSGLLPDCTSGEFRDSSTLRLWGLQGRLVTEVAGSGTPLVLAVIGGRALALEAEIAVSRAAIMAWLPGEAGGRALARLLFGQANPAGRLPVSLPRSVGQVPAYYNHRAGGGRSATPGDHLDESTRPLFPFGHGLSFTSFEYLDLACPLTVDVHATINLSVTIRNDGTRAGDEVVQVYLDDKVADVARPVRRLAGFKRVHVPAGASRRIKFLIDASQLAYFDRRMQFVVDPGEVEVMVGASSRDVRLRASVVLQGERRPLLQKQVIATQVEVVDVAEQGP
jgi:beta-glucosidase